MLTWNKSCIRGEKNLRSGTEGLSRSCQAAFMSIKYVTQMYLNSSFGLPAFSLSEPLFSKMKSRRISSFMVIYSAVQHEPEWCRQLNFCSKCLNRVDSYISPTHKSVDDNFTKSDTVYGHHRAMRLWWCGFNWQQFALSTNIMKCLSEPSTSQASTACCVHSSWPFLPIGH